MKTEIGSVIREWGWEEGYAEGREEGHEEIFTLLDHLEALLGRPLVAAERGRVRADFARRTSAEQQALAEDPTPLLALLRDA